MQNNLFWQFQPSALCRYLSFWLGIMLFVVSCGGDMANQSAEESSAEMTTATTERIVSLNGSLTELLFELGYGDQIVGLDVTSTYPAAAASLPKLGHVSQLNTEALLALQPSLVVVAKTEAENAMLKQLEEAGLKIVAIEQEAKLDNAFKAAQSLQEHLNFPAEKLAAIQQKITDGQEALADVLSEVDANEKPSVLFIYARGTGRLMVGGTTTSANDMIEMVGGQNAITSFEDFAALTPEALLEAAPDVILMFESGLASLDGLEGLGQIPGMAEVPAYKNGRVITMDGHYLLGFGPRAAQAALELATQLHQTGKAI